MKPKARPSGPIAALVVCGVAVVALCAGGVAGAVTGAAISEGPTGPTAPPEVPTAFPGPDLFYLPSVTADFFESWLTVDNDFDCERDAENPVMWTDAEHVLSCHDDPYYATLDVEFDGPDQVRYVRAMCDQGPRAGEDYCRTYLSLVLDTAFQAIPELREEARVWGEDNVDNDAHVVLGEMLIVMERDVYRVLTIVPNA
jgi:hypothetical protein